MFLAVDVGNTHTTLGMMRGDEVVGERRITTNRRATQDELHVVLRFLDGIESVPHGEWIGAAICSVVPGINKALQHAIERVTGAPALVLRQNMELGVGNTYSNPMEVGMDRLANAVAGVDRYGAPLLVIDFGTATTLDIVSSAGDYEGGVILPGLEATADALHTRTSQLPHISIERPSSALGKNTVDAMRSGIYFGSVEAVDGVANRIESELGYPLKRIATGGLARVLGPDIPKLHAVDPHLTLLGIRRIWERNRP